ncbi:C-type mannose receptor 2 [Nymphon striatum]|nr:C-type mannose receptor 2 [Nymphon striatum]
MGLWQAEGRVNPTECSASLLELQAMVGESYFSPRSQELAYLAVCLSSSSDTVPDLNDITVSNSSSNLSNSTLSINSTEATTTILPITTTTTTTSTPSTTTLSTTTTGPTKCNKDWRKHDNNCYRIYDEPKTWNEARVFCLEINSDLVSITTSAELAWLTSFVSEVRRGSLWIGLKYENISKQFKWTDKSPLSVVYWSPNLDGHQEWKRKRCVYIRSDWSKDPGYWSLSSCDRHMLYICKTKAQKAADGFQTTSAPGCAPGMVAWRSSCYWFINEPLNAYYSTKTCMKNGGHVFDIEDLPELYFIKSMLAERDNETFWTGLNQLRTKGIFQWSHGQPTNLNARQLGLVLPTAYKLSAAGRCSYMKMEKGVNSMKLTNCFEKHKSLCKKLRIGYTTPIPWGRTTPTPTPEPKLICSNKHFKTQGKMCYYYAKKLDTTSWIHGKEQCETFGGSLMSYESSKEMNNLDRPLNPTPAAESDEDSDNEMDTHTPMDTITPEMAQPYYDLYGIYDNGVWIGLRIMPMASNSSDITWIDGTTLLHNSIKIPYGKTVPYCAYINIGNAGIEFAPYKEVQKSFQIKIGGRVAPLLEMTDLSTDELNETALEVLDTKVMGDLEIQYPQDVPCPTGEANWYYFNGFCYFASENFAEHKLKMMSWENAKKSCIRHGANLVSIHNTKEAKFVDTVMVKFGFNPFWIGLKYDEQSRMFSWSDKSLLNIRMWYPSRLLPMVDGKCTILHQNSEYWHLERCYTHRHYVCKKLSTVMPPSTEKPKDIYKRIEYYHGKERLVTLRHLFQSWIILEIEQSRNSRGIGKAGNKCYTYVPYTNSWSGARSRCRAKSATLVSIHSIKEQEFLDVLSNPKRGYWIGLKFNRNENTFKWDDGTEVSYTNWATGQPNRLKKFITGTLRKIMASEDPSDPHDSRQQTNFLLC